MSVDKINKLIADTKKNDDSFEARYISDTHHTFDELYYHRMVLTALAFNTHSHLCWKSWLHHDGTMFDNMFIVNIETPKGSFSYHYNSKYWDLFKVLELEMGREWDGHQPTDIDRLLSIDV